MESYKEQLRDSKVFFETLPWDNKDFYANFLAQTYYFVCHSTRLLARSTSYFGVDRDALYRRFVEHIKEENYHERIAISDLKKLGVDLAQFPELPITKAFWERQYYLIDQSKGTSLLGYILYLEAISINCFDKVYSKIVEGHGQGSCNFVKVHTLEDQEHVTHAVEMINALPAVEKELVWSNYYQTAELYQTLLERVRRYSERKGDYNYRKAV